MYRSVEINGVLHLVRDMAQFDASGAIVLDDTPVAVHLEIEDPGVVSIREQMERLFARERAQLAALRAEEESEEDENDFEMVDETYRGTSSAHFRELGERIIEAAEALEHEADEKAASEKTASNAVAEKPAPGGSPNAAPKAE